MESPEDNPIVTKKWDDTTIQGRREWLTSIMPESPSLIEKMAARDFNELTALQQDMLLDMFPTD